MQRNNDQCSVKLRTAAASQLSCVYFHINKSVCLFICELWYKCRSRALVLYNRVCFSSLVAKTNHPGDKDGEAGFLVQNRRVFMMDGALTNCQLAYRQTAATGCGCRTCFPKRCEYSCHISYGFTAGSPPHSKW